MKGGDGAMVQWCNTTRGAESLQSLFPCINNLRAILPLERASSHATGGCQCREESCEGKQNENANVRCEGKKHLTKNPPLRTMDQDLMFSQRTFVSSERRDGCTLSMPSREQNA